MIDSTVEREIDINDAARHYLSERFKANPSYSFNDPDIMINHSIQVQDLAMQISEGQDINRAALSLGALFHDVGKSALDEKGQPIEPAVLQEKHKEFNRGVAEPFLLTLDLDDVALKLIYEIMDENMEIEEARIMKEADILAFLADKKLQEVFNKWANETNQPEQMQRKLNKFFTLKLPRSIEIGKPLAEQMAKRWGLQFGA